MLYKVTPMMRPTRKVDTEDGATRRRRRTAVYDAEGREVLITLMCLKCRQIKPLLQFGLRKMADGAVRNQPWCRTCRSVAAIPQGKGEGAALLSRVLVPSDAEAARATSGLAEPRPEGSPSPQPTQEPRRD